MIMKLIVNKDKCIGCGQCVSICDKVFDFDDDNLAKVVASPIPEELEEDATVAMESCPTGAIEEDNITTKASRHTGAIEKNSVTTKESCPTGAIEEE